MSQEDVFIDEATLAMLDALAAARSLPREAMLKEIVDWYCEYEPFLRDNPSGGLEVQNMAAFGKPCHEAEN